MSATPKTDALFFPYGRNATAAAEPSLLVCMTQYELLERELAALRGENTTLRDQLKPCWGQFDKLMAEIATLRERADKAERERAVAITQFAEWTKVLEQSKQEAVAEALRMAVEISHKHAASNTCTRLILALIPADSIAKEEEK